MFKGETASIRNNHIAAILALTSLLLLIPAYSLPFMAVSSMGSRESYSLIKSTGALAQDGRLFLAGIIFTFSFIFPITKLLVLLATITTFWNISDGTRHRLKQIVTFTGKYSMLDVMVAAVLVVAFKISDMISFRLLPGIWIFCIAIIISFAAGQFMDLSSLEPKKEPDLIPKKDPGAANQAGAPPPAKTKAGRRRWIRPVLGLLTAALITGVLLLVLPLHQPIDQVKLLKKQELMPSFWPSLDKPDYFLKIRVKDGWEITTRVFENTPIGNGLIYPIDPVPLEDITEITIYDHNLIKDEALDRMNVTGRDNVGMYYEVRLDGPQSPMRTLGLGLTIVCGVLLLLVLMLALKRFVIR